MSSQLKEIVEIINDVRNDFLYMMNDFYEKHNSYPEHMATITEYMGCPEIVNLNGLNHLTPSIFRLFE